MPPGAPSGAGSGAAAAAGMPPPRAGGQQQQVGAPAGEGDPFASEAVAHLRSLFARLWRLQCHNRSKEVLWRLAVNGVPWAGGHGLAPGRPCDCGWAPAAALDAAARSAAWQDHRFWSCPVGMAVRAELQRHLPEPLLRHHLWLVLAPAGVQQPVWDVVALAALSAMRFGGKALFAKARDREEQRAGGRQLRLEEAWGLLELPNPEDETVTVLAGRRAVADFWGCLQSFLALHHGVPHSWAPAETLPPGHPFIASLPPDPWGLRLNILPADAAV